MLKKTDSIMWNDENEMKWIILELKKSQRKDKLLEKNSRIKELLVQNIKYLYSSQMLNLLFQALAPNLTLHKSTFKIFVPSHVTVYIYNNNCICISQNWTTIAKRNEHVMNIIVYPRIQKCI